MRRRAWPLATALLVTLILPGLVWGDTLAGTVYAPKSRRAQALYTVNIDRDPDTGIWRSVYWTPAGVLVAEDELTLIDGRLQRYRYRRPNVAETASVERVGDEILLVQEIAGKRAERREKFDATVTVGPTLVLYIQQHWAALMNGQELRTRHCVLDHLRSFTFRLALDRARSAGTGLAVVKMTPVHPTVRAVVSPAYFALTSDGHRLESITGRVLPRVPDGDAGRPVVGELVIETRSE